MDSIMEVFLILFVIAIATPLIVMGWVTMFDEIKYRKEEK